MSDRATLHVLLPGLLGEYLSTRRATPDLPSDAHLALRATQMLCEALSRLLPHRLVASAEWDSNYWLDGFLPRVERSSSTEADLLGVVFLINGVRSAGVQPLRARLASNTPDGPVTYTLGFGAPDGPFPEGFSVLDLHWPDPPDEFGWLYRFHGTVPESHPET